MSDLAFTLLVVVGLAGVLGTGLWWLLGPNGVDSEQPEGKE